MVEYKGEAFEAFVGLMSDMRRTIANRLFRAQLEQPRAMRAQRVTRISGPSDAPSTGVRGAYAAGGPIADQAARPEASPTGIAATAQGSAVPAAGTASGPVAAYDPAFARVGRNDPCPCGSGKKFKKCHGSTV